MNGDEPQLPSTPFPLESGLILLGRRGSEAHGLRLDDGSNDRDLMGIVVPPPNHYFGLKEWEGAEAMRGCWDTVLYEVRKFVRLLCRQNPNVLDLLWVDPSDFLLQTNVGEHLVKHRRLFRHEMLAREAFLGYASGQLHRMTAFDAKTMAHINYLEQMLLDAGIDPLHVVAEPPIQVPDRMSLVATEYRQQRQKYKRAYMGAKRWGNIQKFGYDVKHATHLIRLLNMGFEYLTTGELQVRRTDDREMLLEIKRGEWSLEQIQSYAAKGMVDVEGVKSVLPQSIDMEKVDEILEEIVMTQLELEFS